ncbi:MAG: type II toxin-antitoxin system VapC family toxin [Deltaproteobacteria bacterium]|nr:type II toxin-antitoxin system VapC family toxin [Deltaproteobacteria bacterium]
MILDTNAVSALADGVASLEVAAARVDVFALPVIVIGEFRFGILRSRHRRRYESWLDRLVAVCNVLRLDEETAAHYSTLREELRAAGRPIPSNDAWIAALARQHDLPVLSRDAHFDEVTGLTRTSW